MNFSIITLVAIVVIVFASIYFTSPFLYRKAINSKICITIPDLIRMRLRGVPCKRIVKNLIRCQYVDISIKLHDLETHFLAGGNIDNVVSSLISAKEGGVELDFRTASSADLVGIDLTGKLSEVVVESKYRYKKEVNL
jgi:uncharacterized protein YqfA (UPF0365 family)